MRIIGITGASGSGKSSIARALQHALALDGQSPQLSILPVDAYYRDLSFLTLNEREAVDLMIPRPLSLSCWPNISRPSNEAKPLAVRAMTLPLTPVR